MYIHGVTLPCIVTLPPIVLEYSLTMAVLKITNEY